MSLCLWRVFVVEASFRSIIFSFYTGIKPLFIYGKLPS